MSGISTTVEIYDKMSGVFAQITQAVNMTISAYERMQDTIAQPLSSSALDGVGESVNKITSAFQEAQEKIEQLCAKPIEIGTEFAETLADDISAEPVKITAELTEVLTDPTAVLAEPVEVPVKPEEPLEIVVMEPVEVPVKPKEPLAFIEVEAVEIPVEPVWSGVETPDVFVSSGVERYRQEIDSANSMVEKLVSTQGKIAAQAQKTKIFPSGMAKDMSTIQERIERIQSEIEKMESRKIDSIGADKLNNELEEMRNSLSQAITEQEALNSAVNKMDVSAANEAYRQLHATIDTTDRHIRDNISAQEDFNEKLEEGEKKAGGLSDKIKGFVGSYASKAIKGAQQFAEKAMEASDAQIKAENGLATSMSNQGNTRLEFDAVVNYAGELQGSTSIADEAFITGAAELSSCLSDSEALMAIMPTLGDYAVGMSGGVEVSTEEMAKYASQLTSVLGGSYEELEQKGFKLSDAQKQIIENGTEMERVAVINEVIGDSWDGLAESMAQTPQGQIQSLKNSFNELMEVVGYQLLPVIGTLAETVSGIIDNPAILSVLASVGEIVGNVLGMINEILQTPAFIQLAEMVSDFLMMIAGLFENPALQGCLLTIMDIIAQLAEVVMVLLPPLFQLIEVFYELLEPVLQTVSILIDALMPVVEMIGDILMGFVPLVQALLDPLVLLLDLAMQLLFAVLEPLMPILQFLTDLILMIFDALMPVMDAISALIGVLFVLLEPVFVLLDVIGTLIEALLEPLMTILEPILDMVGLLLELLTPLLQCLEPIYAILNEAFIPILELLNPMLETLTNALGKIADAVNYVIEVINKFIGWLLGAAETVAGSIEGSGSAPTSAFNRYNQGSMTSYTAAAAPATTYTSNDFNMSGSLFSGGAGGGVADSAGKTAGNTDRTAGNTGKIADSAQSIDKNLSMAEEDLKYLRDLAERDVINRFTTAELNVEFTANNNISSDLDIDGVVTVLGEKVTEMLVSSAQGVHA